MGKIVKGASKINFTMFYGNYYYIIIENFPQKFSPCGRLPWATMTVGVLRCRLLSKNLFRKVSVVHNSCFQLQVSHCCS